MADQIFTLNVNADHSIPVSVEGGSAVLSVDSTGGTVYYGGDPSVSSSSNIGSISPSGSATVTQNVWVRGSSAATVTVTLTSQWKQQPIVTSTPQFTTVVLEPTGGDDAANMIAAIAKVGGFGEIIMGPGTFLWQSGVPSLPPSATGIAIRGKGKGVTTVKLSSGAPRFIDFNRTADYQTFQNIELSDFTVDCNQTTGKHHVIIGTYVNGSSATTGQRINLLNIAVRRVDAINVPSSLTNGDWPGAVTGRWCISLLCFQLADNESTQNILKKILIQDCHFYGGNVGAQVFGTTSATNPTNLNVWLDEITFERCWHSCAQLGPATNPVAVQPGIATIPVSITANTHNGTKVLDTFSASLPANQVFHVQGTGIPSGATVTVDPGGTSGVLSANATADGTGVTISTLRTWNSINFQIGSFDYGGRGYVKQCYGDSAFTGVGISNLMDFNCVDTTIVDSGSGSFGFNNFSYVQFNDYPTSASTNTANSGTTRVDLQKTTWQRCHARYSTAFTGGANGQVPAAFYAAKLGSNLGCGTIKLKDCDVHDLSGIWHASDSIGWQGVCQTYGVDFDGFHVEKSGITIANGTASTSVTLIRQDATVTSKFRARKLTLVGTGTNSSGNTQTLRGLAIWNPTSGTTTVTCEIDDVHMDPTGLTGTSGAFNWNGIVFGIATAMLNLGGRVTRAYHTGNPATSGTSTGITVTSTTGLTLSNLRISDCDLSASSTTALSLDATQVAGVSARNVAGFNPVGVVVVAVPATTASVAAQTYDRTFYITNGTATLSLVIQNGPTISVAASATQTVHLPANKTMSYTYASGSPAQVVEGL
jgi:hypothetical protein